MTTGAISWQERYELESQRRQELNQTLKAFAKAANGCYGSYAYSSGYYEGMILELLARGSQEDRDFYLETLRNLTEDFEHRILIDALKKDPE
jgi:hypothetical protein